MKVAGFLCKIDKLGRIVIPKAIRQEFDLNVNDELELFTDENGIEMRKYRRKCLFCGNEELSQLFEYKGKIVCEHCKNELENIKTV